MVQLKPVDALTGIRTGVATSASTRRQGWGLILSWVVRGEVCFENCRAFPGSSKSDRSRSCVDGDIFFDLEMSCFLEGKIFPKSAN